MIRQQQPKRSLHWVITTNLLYGDFGCGFGLADLFLAELLLLFSFLDDVDAVDLDLSLLLVAAAKVLRCRACWNEFHCLIETSIKFSPCKH